MSDDRNLQVETPCEEATQLSAQLGNTVLLKREDQQQVHCVACPAGDHMHMLCPPFATSAFATANQM